MSANSPRCPPLAPANAQLWLLIASSLCRGAGLILILAWATKMTVEAAMKLEENGFSTAEAQVLAEYIVTLMDAKSLVGMTFEFLGGMMFNAVLWTDIVVHISRNDDVKMQKLQSDLS